MQEEASQEVDDKTTETSYDNTIYYTFCSLSLFSMAESIQLIHAGIEFEFFLLCLIPVVIAVVQLVVWTSNPLKRPKQAPDYSKIVESLSNHDGNSEDNVD